MKTTHLSFIIAGAALVATTASAELLSPGTSSGLTGWSPAGGGNLIYSQTYSFVSSGVPFGGASSTGVLEQTITQQLSGELLFGLRIAQLNTAPDTHLSNVMVGEWAGFQVDTDFLLDSGLSNPGFASRSAGSGDLVTWSEFSGPMSDGKNTSWVQILTDAIGYNDRGHVQLNFSDGSVAQIRIAAPSTIPAPGAIALLAGALLSGIRRRR